MITQRMNQVYVNAIINDPELQGIIAKRCNKSISTIYRWAHTNDEKLTMHSVLSAVRDYMNLPKSVSLIEAERELV